MTREPGFTLFSNRLGMPDVSFGMPILASNGVETGFYTVFKPFRSIFGMPQVDMWHARMWHLACQKLTLVCQIWLQTGIYTVQKRCINRFNVDFWHTRNGIWHARSDTWHARSWHSKSESGCQNRFLACQNWHDAIFGTSTTRFLHRFQTVWCQFWHQCHFWHAGKWHMSVLACHMSTLACQILTHAGKWHSYTVFKPFINGVVTLWHAISGITPFSNRLFACLAEIRAELSNMCSSIAKGWNLNH